MLNKLKTWLWLFLSFALLFCLTAQHGVSWQDSGEYQWRCLQGDYNESVPLCRSHPVYLLVGNILSQIPGGYPFSLNAFSGIMAAVMLANLSLLASELGFSRRVAVPVIITLGLSHCLWWLSTIAEVYTLSGAFFTLELLCFIRLCKTPSTWRLCQLAFLNGLGLSIHNFALIALPVYFLAVLTLMYSRRLRLNGFMPGLLVWLLGLLPLLVVVYAKIDNTPNRDFGYWFKDVLVGNYDDQVFNITASGSLLKVNLALATLSFLSLLLPLAVIGIRFWLKDSNRPALLRNSLVAILVMHFVFFVRYTVPDQFTFIIPSLIMSGLMAMAALRDIKWRFMPGLVLFFALMQPVWYAAAGAYLGGEHGIKRPQASADRNEGRYWAVPWKHNEHSAQLWADKVIATLKPGDTIYIDNTTCYALYFRAGQNPPFNMVHGSKPDWEMVIANIESSYFVNGKYEIPAGYQRVQVADNFKLYRLVKE